MGPKKAHRIGAAAIARFARIKKRKDIGVPTISPQDLERTRQMNCRRTWITSSHCWFQRRPIQSIAESNNKGSAAFNPR